MTDDELKELEDFASFQFDDAEIAAMFHEYPEVAESLEIDLSEYDRIQLCILRGRLRSEAETRKAIRDQAKQGSTAAQKLFMDLIQKRKQNEEAEQQ